MACEARFVPNCETEPEDYAEDCIHCVSEQALEEELKKEEGRKKKRWII